MNEAANGTAPLMERAETLIGTVGAKLKEARASLEERPPTATESAFSSAEAASSSDPHAAAAEAEAKLQPATDRAEAALDKAGERLGVFAAAVSHRVRKAAALVREEAEDIVAEAQSVRRKDAS